MADTYEFSPEECEDLRVGLLEGISSYSRLADNCGDLENLKEQKKIWHDQAERLRALLAKFRQ